VTGLSNAVEGAEDAAAAQQARDEKVQKATGEETGAAAGAATKPDAVKGGTAAARGSAKGLPVPVQKALNRDKILVLGFFNPKSADDRAVRRSLGDVNRWGGEVVVRSAGVGTISRYGTIARGADVDQSPTVVVVDRNAKAETLVGFVDAPSIDQAVVDAMRASGGIIEDKYLSAINAACATAGVQQVAVAQSTEPSQIRGEVAAQGRVWKRFMTRFAAIKAPARWQGLKRASLEDGRAMSANYTAWLVALGPNPSAAKAVGTLGRFNARGRALTKSWNARMDEHNVLSCGAQT
jgi:hypothetical protein